MAGDDGWTMLRIYFDVGSRMVRALFRATSIFLVLLGAAPWVAGAIRPEWSQMVVGVTGFNVLWVPLAFVTAHLFFAAMHERTIDNGKNLLEQCSCIAESTGSLETEKYRAKLSDRDELRRMLWCLRDDAHDYYSRPPGESELNPTPAKPFDAAGASRWAEEVRKLLDGTATVEFAGRFPPGQISHEAMLRDRVTTLTTLGVALQPEHLKT